MLSLGGQCSCFLCTCILNYQLNKAKFILHTFISTASSNLPTVLKTFLTVVVFMIPADRIKSAIIGEIFMLSHRPINGRAAYIPFWENVE